MAKILLDILIVVKFVLFFRFSFSFLFGSLYLYNKGTATCAFKNCINALK